MGSLPAELVRPLRDELGIQRVVETGTYKGVTARYLADVFDRVLTVELSPEIAASAATRLADKPNVTVICGDSRSELGGLADRDTPTLYFLDGHWSGGPTAGETEPCPVLNEIAVLSTGHERDCILIDDARLFAASPPPPHNPDQWPTLVEVFDALRKARPRHNVTVIGDLILATPQEVKSLIDAYGRGELAGEDDADEPRVDPVRRAWRRVRAAFIRRGWRIP